MHAARAWAATAIGAVGLAACQPTSDPAPADPAPSPAPSAAPDAGIGSASTAAAASPFADEPHADALVRLLALEEQRRAATDFSALPAANAALGPDPYRIAAVPGTDLLVGVLRGADAVVLVGPDGREVARAPAPASPSALAVGADGEIWVGGEAASALARFRVVAGTLRTLGGPRLAIPGVRALALAPDGATLYAADEVHGQVLALALARDHGAVRVTDSRAVTACRGGSQLVALATGVVMNCVLDHRIAIAERTDAGVRMATLAHDGPLWGFAVAPAPDGGLVIAAGGVEDHPLVRADGGFGYIDSFIFLYRRERGAPALTRVAAINASELGVVTPKWLALANGADGGLTLTTAGYGSGRRATLTWARGDLAAAPQVSTAAWPAGIADAVVRRDGAIVAADPLLDAWVVARGDVASLVPVAGAPRPLPSRLGEALFFTTLMSPWNSAAGELSRFTCETCHFEGFTDGRTHFTGRDDVHATTRSLAGLGNDRPYFSRALDKTMTRMVNAEFRVANRHNGRDPWFAVTAADVPWLAALTTDPAELTPERLRAALMTFLVDFTPRTNPAAVDHARFTADEAAGARVFAERCAGCHAPRLLADDPASAVPAARWEALVLSPAGPIVWGQDRYEKTGVVPYVHAEGARIPSLRRLYKKAPYFTNGAARSLDDVLARFAQVGPRTYHDGAPPDAAHLSPTDQAALRAFLALL